MLGIVLFMVSCLPTCWASFRGYNDFSILKHEVKPSKHYDDELVYTINTAIFDLYASLPMSMEQKTYYKHLKSLKSTLEYRYKMYVNMLPMTKPRSLLNTYYKKRSDEFYNLLQKINV
jgi:hypothetical protein